MRGRDVVSRIGSLRSRYWRRFARQGMPTPRVVVLESDVRPLAEYAEQVMPDSGGHFGLRKDLRQSLCQLEKLETQIRQGEMFLFGMRVEVGPVRAVVGSRP